MRGREVRAVPSVPVEITAQEDVPGGSAHSDGEGHEHMTQNPPR
jgi:hypothetical protein